MKAYDKVRMARDTSRPTGSDFIKNIFEDFIELHGDRHFGDDKAVIAGIARIQDLPVTVIAHEKGKDTRERMERNFGSANPEGYRKALRQMKLAEKFNRPVVCFIDTSGAYCGIGAEERGQGQAIAENLAEMSALKVPVISVLIGEGGSGGALGLAVADEVWMLVNSVYSVITPEACASILFKDSKKAETAAESLKLTPEDLLGFKVIEKIIPETETLYKDLKSELIKTLTALRHKSTEDLLAARYNKFRKIKGEVR